MLAKDRNETVVGKVKGEGIVLGCVLLDFSIAVNTNLFFLFRALSFFGHYVPDSEGSLAETLNPVPVRRLNLRLI